MSSTLNTFVPVLDGTNYQQWAAAMQLFLMSQGQWRVIIKNAPLPVYKNTTPVQPIKASNDTVDVQATRCAQAAADQAAMLTEPTNQDALDEWEELVSKAVGNIRLRLHHTIAYQYNAEDAANLWQSLLNKYGQPGILHAYIEFKGAMDTSIPNNSDPSPSLDKMMAHFARLRDLRFELAPKVLSSRYFSPFILHSFFSFFALCQLLSLFCPLSLCFRCFHIVNDFMTITFYCYLYLILHSLSLMIETRT